MKIVTFGSCMSRYLTEALARKVPRIQRLGSVYHNRIDTFVDTVVTQSRPFMPREVISRMRFQPGADKDALAIINNQYPEPLGTLGRHLTAPGFPGFLAGLAQADLVLMDNFMDVAANVFQHREGPGRIFFNSKAVVDPLQDLVGIGLLTAPIGARKWAQLFDWVRSQNPRAHMVFVNFPTRHHTNKAIRPRGDDFAKAIAHREDVVMLPIVDIQPHELCPGTQSHFIPAVYDRYVEVMLPRLSRPVGELAQAPASEPVLVELPVEEASLDPELPEEVATARNAGDTGEARPGNATALATPAAPNAATPRGAGVRKSKNTGRRR